ncbi:hypothetical protein Y1Q_0017923 [Alligator mississippiensis]|uniref:Uncharacterized protein n=1 Tax=Alligator mississippiensis TaxID=8496 RepID=A0A151MXN6_ALLMI|nr:hypothetical protein Y1Q_0017923 [Alligator mississippiensis]
MNKILLSHQQKDFIIIVLYNLHISTPQQKQLHLGPDNARGYQWTTSLFVLRRSQTTVSPQLNSAHNDNSNQLDSSIFGNSSP